MSESHKTPLDIHNLMRQFAALDGTVVGRGPKHPTEPNLAIASEVADFLEQYPVVRSDQGYVDFLECYAGASVFLPNEELPDELYVDIYGFLPVSMHMVEEEGPIIDEDGNLVFCTTLLHGTQEIVFGFRVTKPGIFRCIAHKNLSLTIEWYCATFLEWLERLIEKQGQMN